MPEVKGEPWTGEMAVNPSAAAVRTKSASTAIPSNQGEGLPFRYFGETSRMRSSDGSASATRSSTPQSKHWMLVRATRPSTSSASTTLATNASRVVSCAASTASYLISRLIRTGSAPRSRRRAATCRSSGIVGGRSARVSRRISRASASAASWETTTSSSAVRWTSSSSVETPSARARPKASSVFSGQRPAPPRWACRSNGVTRRASRPRRRTSSAPRVASASASG